MLHNDAAAVALRNPPREFTGDVEMKSEHPPSITMLIIIPLGLSAVFLLDILGPYDPVVGVLYLPLILFSTRVLSGFAVAYVGLAAGVLTCASFVLANNEGFDKITYDQWGAILAAIAVTTTFAVVLSRRRQGSQAR